MVKNINMLATFIILNAICYVYVSASFDKCCDDMIKACLLYTDGSTGYTISDEYNGVVKGLDVANYSRGNGYVNGYIQGCKHSVDKADREYDYACETNPYTYCINIKEMRERTKK